MRFWKYVNEDKYIGSVGNGQGGTEITETEYNTILDAIRNRPTAPDGYGYRMREDLTWELYDLPVMEESI